MNQLLEAFIVITVALFVILCAALLVVAATVVIAGGAFVWAYAIAAAHRARLHSIQAASTERSLQETNEAVDEAKERFGLKPPRAPTDEEMREMLLAERPSTNGHRPSEEEYTTLGNEHIPEAPPMSVGGDGDMYATGPGR